MPFVTAIGNYGTPDLPFKSALDPEEGGTGGKKESVFFAIMALARINA